MKTENNAVITDKKYCIWCGNEIKPDAKFCTKCGKQQIEEENQLVDWLIKHTKDKLKGDAESSLFDALKNFILSHLYGTIMSIAIVAAIGTTVYASEPYIEKYRDADAPEYIHKSTNVNSNSESESEYDSASNIAVHDLCSRYLNIINNVGEYYADTGELISVDDMLVPDSIGYGGNYGIVKDERFKTTLTRVERTSIDATVFEYDEFTMDVTKQMAKEGYIVAECTATERIEDSNTSETIYSRDVIFSCIWIDNIWYIAENEVLSVYENEEYLNPFTVDKTIVTSVVTGYVKAVYAGEDTSAYLFEIPDDITTEPVYETMDLASEEQMYSEPELYIESTYVGAPRALGIELEKSGYTVVTATVRISFAINEEQEQFISTTNHIDFVCINDTYMIINDDISAKMYTS